MWPNRSRFTSSKVISFTLCRFLVHILICRQSNYHYAFDLALLDSFCGLVSSSQTCFLFLFCLDFFWRPSEVVLKLFVWFPNSSKVFCWVDLSKVIKENSNFSWPIILAQFIFVVLLVENSYCLCVNYFRLVFNIFMNCNDLVF